MAIHFHSVLLEITCADSAEFMNLLIDKGVQLFDIDNLDSLTFRACTSQSDYQKMIAIGKKQGVSVKKLKNIGCIWKMRLLANRPFLIFFATLLLLFGCFLQNRILFIQVEGNKTISDQQILDAAQECGIQFGASRRIIRSEKMKNELLERIPQLKWAGINTAGCTAIISVKEKSESESKDEKSKQVTSIVAMRDGIIQNCTVYQGNSLCVVGQAVKAGQTLVSGYTDCGTVTRATQAKAEIQALTYRQLELITPKPEIIRGKYRDKTIRYSIRIGKKVIKFSKDTGNSMDHCVKIYSEKCLLLPGGFALPIALIKETSCYYESPSEIKTMPETEDWLADYARVYLQKEMVAGVLISGQTEIRQDDAACYLRGKFTCIEMIGQTRVEQTILGE